MIKRLLLALSLGLGGCAAQEVRLEAVSQQAPDHYYAHFENVKRLATQVLAEHGVHRGDVVALMPLRLVGTAGHSAPEAGTYARSLFDDAMTAGLVGQGVRVVRNTETESLIANATATGPTGDQALMAEYGTIGLLRKLREQGVTRVMFYRLITAQNESAESFPTDRCFIKIVDAGSGQTTYASLITAGRKPAN